MNFIALECITESGPLSLKTTHAIGAGRVLLTDELVFDRRSCD